MLDFKERLNRKEEEAVQVQNKVNDIMQDLEVEHELR
jgi:uncharacterized protein (UPF0335 family)